jgi:hypothetical protein
MIYFPSTVHINANAIQRKCIFYALLRGNCVWIKKQFKGAYFFLRDFVFYYYFTEEIRDLLSLYMRWKLQIDSVTRIYTYVCGCETWIYSAPQEIGFSCEWTEKKRKRKRERERIKGFSRIFSCRWPTVTVLDLQIRTCTFTQLLQRLLFIQYIFK